ncbi:MAG: hypothetical protein U0V56_00170 [Actinomycetota bacterium]
MRSPNAWPDPPKTGIRRPDALIAATALEHGLGLMTRNVADFAGVEGLKTVVPA